MLDRRRPGARLAHPRVCCAAARATDISQGYVNNSETQTQRASRLLRCAVRHGRVRYGPPRSAIASSAFLPRNSFV